jgi:hypothetical protein
LGASYSGSQVVHILTPNDKFSDKVYFTLTCFAVTSVTAIVTPSLFLGTCPKTFNFSAAITVNGPGTVTYMWEKSNGAFGFPQSITFTAAGSKKVYATWTLGDDYVGWQRVHTLTPNAIKSNKANFKLDCI